MQNFTLRLDLDQHVGEPAYVGGSACSRWNAIRCALLGPTPGSRPSSSIRSWTTPSYTDCWPRPSRSRCPGRPPAERAERLAGQRVGLGLRVAVGGDDQVAEVGQVVGVAAVEAARLDLDADQLADAVDGDRDRAAGDGAVDAWSRRAGPGRPAAAPASAGPAGAGRSCRSRRRRARRRGSGSWSGHFVGSVGRSLVRDLLDHLGAELALEQLGAVRDRGVGVGVVGVGVGVGRGARGRPASADRPSRVCWIASRAAALRRRVGAGLAASAAARAPGRRQSGRASLRRAPDAGGWRGLGAAGAGGAAGGCPPARRGAPGSTIVSTCQSAPTTSIAAWRRISSLPPLTKESRAPALRSRGSACRRRRPTTWAFWVRWIQVSRRRSWSPRRCRARAGVRRPG